MKISEIMTKEVVTADSNESVLGVAKLMREHNIGCVPVTENGKKIIGVITDRDIVLNMAKYNFDPTNTSAKEITSNIVYRVKPEADVWDALELMKKQKIRRLPVMTDETIVGFVSLGDIAVYTNENMEVGDALIEISKPSRIENR